MQLFKLVLCAALMGTAFAQAPKGVVATRLYSGADGETHAEEINLSQAAAPNGPQPDLLRGEGVRFATRGPGTTDDWHVTPRRQYLITLRGRVEIEVGGGKKVTAGPGSVLLVEDLIGKGHRAKVVSDDEWHVMFISLPTPAKQ